MLEAEILTNLSKTIGMQPSHLLFFIIITFVSLFVIIIAIILDSKEISGFNFDAIRFKKYLNGTKSLDKVSTDLNILKIQSFIKGKPSVTSTNAQIIQLAILGYIEIIKDGDRTELHKTKKPVGDLPYEVRMFYDALFSERDIITNERKLIDKKKGSENTKLARNLELIFKDLASDLESEGYYKRNYRAIIYGIKILALIVIFITSITFNIEGVYNSQLVYIPIAVELLLFSIILLGKKSFLGLILTERGKEFLRDIQGVYLYIKTAEIERLNFHNKPKEYNNFFMELLPYALLFGMSDKWLRHLPLQTSDWGDDIWNEDFASW
jgi:uncharacterized integral membrane protein